MKDAHTLIKAMTSSNTTRNLTVSSTPTINSSLYTPQVVRGNGVSTPTQHRFKVTVAARVKSYRFTLVK
jgi:hypothetical protein